ncbi:MAG: hypothetical protein PWR21_77 [Methanoculleus sp.]|nr:hypothetical protein [Methanoculleus sp.]
MFQSLSGFLMRCDGEDRIAHMEKTIRFQSLSGFLMRCDFEFDDLDILREISFNPYRVF